MTRGDKAIRWIEQFCVYPHGFSKGRHVVLTEQQRAALRQIFDTDKSPEVTGPLAAYLALFQLPGRATWRRTFPQFRSVQTFFRLGTRSVPICALC